MNQQDGETAMKAEVVKKIVNAKRYCKDYTWCIADALGLELIPAPSKAVVRAKRILFDEYILDSMIVHGAPPPEFLGIQDAGKLQMFDHIGFGDCRYFMDGVTVFLSHPSFPRIKEGEAVPEIRATVTIKTLENGDCVPYLDTINLSESE